MRARTAALRASIDTPYERVKQRRSAQRRGKKKSQARVGKPGTVTQSDANYAADFRGGHSTLGLTRAKCPTAGIDGFDVLREIEDCAEQPMVVFVTAHKEYAIPAFEVKAFANPSQPILGAVAYTL